MKFYIDIRNDTGRFINQKADKGTFKVGGEGKVNVPNNIVDFERMRQV